MSAVDVPSLFFTPFNKKSKQLLAGKTGSAHIMTKVDFPRQFRFPSGIVKLINCTKSTRNLICNKKIKQFFVPTHVLSIWPCFWQLQEKRRLRLIIQFLSEFYEVKKYVLSITLLKVHIFLFWGNNFWKLATSGGVLFLSRFWIWH